MGPIACLNEENLERDSRQQDKNKPKTKSKKSKREKRTNKQGAVLDSYSRYRKLLYGKILDNKETFAGMCIDVVSLYEINHPARILLSIP